jgi:hypothetical protein
VTWILAEKKSLEIFLSSWNRRKKIVKMDCQVKETLPTRTRQATESFTCKSVFSFPADKIKFFEFEVLSLAARRLLISLQHSCHLNRSLARSTDRTTFKLKSTPAKNEEKNIPKRKLVSERFFKKKLFKNYDFVIHFFPAQATKNLLRLLSAKTQKKIFYEFFK